MPHSIIYKQQKSTFMINENKIKLRLLRNGLIWFLENVDDIIILTPLFVCTPPVGLKRERKEHKT